VSYHDRIETKVFDDARMYEVADEEDDNDDLAMRRILRFPSISIYEIAVTPPACD